MYKIALLAMCIIGCNAGGFGSQGQSFGSLFSSILPDGLKANLSTLAQNAGVCDTLNQDQKTIDFKNAIGASRDVCKRRPPSEGITNKCPETTVEATIRRMDQELWKCVRSEIPRNLLKEVDVCLKREATHPGNGYDLPYSWQDLERAVTPAEQTDLGLSSSDANQCRTQMDKEKSVDCKNVRDIMCGFTFATAPECASKQQQRRTANTLDADDCELVSAKIKLRYPPPTPAPSPSN